LVHGRIGDFLDIQDRSNVRLQSRELSSIYKYTIQQSFKLRLRISITDIQRNVATIPSTSKSLIISRVKNSIMIGTTQKLNEFLQREDFFYLRRYLTHLLQSGEFYDDPLRKLHRYFLENAARYPNIAGDSAWLNLMSTTLFKLFIYYGQYAYRDLRWFVVFSAEEIQDSIFRKARKPANFPFTFIKTKDINLLDIVSANLGGPSNMSIRQFFNITEGMPSILIPIVVDYLRVENESSSIVGLRDQLNFRIVNEINVDLL
jgi:hypothetical protein